MTYSEADFERMKTDPVLRRQYFWQCAQKMRLEALRHPGRKDPLGHALIETADYVLANIDRMVESTDQSSEQ